MNNELFDMDGPFRLVSFSMIVTGMLLKLRRINASQLLQEIMIRYALFIKISQKCSFYLQVGERTLKDRRDIGILLLHYIPFAPLQF